MQNESDDLRDRLKVLTEQHDALKASADVLRQENNQLSSALRRVIDLMPDDKKDEIIRFLVLNSNGGAS